MYLNHKQILISKFSCGLSVKTVFMCLILTAFHFLFFAYSALPQNKRNSDMEKTIQNPIAKIIRIPFLINGNIIYFIFIFEN
jgi:hypothetical protein